MAIAQNSIRVTLFLPDVDVSSQSRHDATEDEFVHDVFNTVKQSWLYRDCGPGTTEWTSADLYMNAAPRMLR